MLVQYGYESARCLVFKRFVEGATLASPRVLDVTSDLSRLIKVRFFWHCYEIPHRKNAIILDESLFMTFLMTNNICTCCYHAAALGTRSDVDSTLQSVYTASHHLIRRNA